MEMAGRLRSSGQPQKPLHHCVSVCSSGLCVLGQSSRCSLLHRRSDRRTEIGTAEEAVLLGDSAAAGRSHLRLRQIWHNDGLCSGAGVQRTRRERTLASRHAAVRQWCSKGRRDQRQMKAGFGDVSRLDSVRCCSRQWQPADSSRQSCFLHTKSDGSSVVQCVTGNGTARN